MKTNLKLLISFVLIALTFSLPQIRSSQATDSLTVVINGIDVEEKRQKMVQVNLDDNLLNFREKLIRKGIITRNDIFLSQEKNDIPQSEEKEWAIKKVLKQKRTFIFGGNDNTLSIRRCKPLPSNLVSYGALLPEQQNRLFNDLGLKNAINLSVPNSTDTATPVSIEPSSRVGVEWSQFPDTGYPQIESKECTSYTFSKTLHGVKKSDSVNAESDLSCLGIGGADIACESEKTALERGKETEIYLLTTHDVAKINLSVDRESIKAHPNLERKIKACIPASDQLEERIKTRISASPKFEELKAKMGGLAPLFSNLQPSMGEYIRAFPQIQTEVRECIRAFPQLQPEGKACITAFSQFEEKIKKCISASISASPNKAEDKLEAKEEEPITVFPKFEGQIKRYLAAFPNLDAEIREMAKNQVINSYQELMKIFTEYGFCIPTNFVLGGRIYCEGSQYVTSFEAAETARKQFSSSVSGSYHGVGVAEKAKITKDTQTEGQQVQEQYNFRKWATVDGSLKNDPSAWEKSLTPNNWRVIERSNLIPIYEFLSDSVQKDCIALIQTFYKEKMDKSVSTIIKRCSAIIST